MSLDYEYLEEKVGCDALSTLLIVTECDMPDGGTGYTSTEAGNNLTGKGFLILQNGTIINTCKTSPFPTTLTRFLS